MNVITNFRTDLNVCMRTAAKRSSHPGAIAPSASKYQRVQSFDKTAFLERLQPVLTECLDQLKVLGLSTDVNSEERKMITDHLEQKFLSLAQSRLDVPWGQLQSSRSLFIRSF